MSARTHAHQIPQAVNHTFNDARGTRPWLRGKELMLSMTGKPLNGKLCLTRIMLRSTNMQQQDWLRSTPTRSVISTRRPPERQTKQHKKQLVQHCRKPWKEPFHRWQPHRSGYQCSACGERVHQALTATTIEERLEQVCPQLQLEASYPEHHSPHKPIQKKSTCQSFGQADQPAIRQPAYSRGNQGVSEMCQLWQQCAQAHQRRCIPSFCPRAHASTGSTTSRIQDMPATLCGREEIDCIARIVTPTQTCSEQANPHNCPPLQKNCKGSASPLITTDH